jgi:ubiquinone/menaquinone biosynthesis C-methylase UbiE
MTSLSHRRAPDVNLRHALQLREYDAIADRIARDRPGRVLDWGCGWGQVTALLRAREHLDVEAFDFRPETGASGPAPLAKYPAITAYIETSDPVRLPYEDDRYDAVLSCGVLEHVGDPDGSLEELKRVLRPGGTLYVYKLPNRRSYLEAIAKRMGLYYHGAWPDDRVYDLGSARVLLERHGFRVDEARLANLLPLTVGGQAVERSAGALWRLNRRLGDVPGVRQLATNVELVARAP